MALPKLLEKPNLLKKKATERQKQLEKQSDLPNTVVFTSFDGSVREVGDLPLNLGRATALASERTLSKIWGSEEEAKDCQNMFEEIYSGFRSLFLPPKTTSFALRL